MIDFSAVIVRSRFRGNKLQRAIQ